MGDIVIDNAGKTVTAYSGNIRIRCNFLVVQMVVDSRQNITVRKSFRLTTKDAFIDALKYKHMMSDRLNQTKIHSASFTDLNLTIPTHVKQYVSGFLDGDGTIALYRGRTVVGFSQSQNSCVPPVLQFIQTHYGGFIHSHAVRQIRPNRRREHTLKVDKFYNQRPLLEDIKENAIIKRDQAEIAMHSYNTLNKEELAVISTNLKYLKTQYQTVSIVEDRLTIPYLAGFFDAEGCITFDKSSPRLFFAQKGCTAILHAIAKRFSTLGKVCDSSSYVAWGRLQDVKDILSQLLPYLIGKREQAEKTIEYITARNKRERSRSQYEYELKEEVKRLKRT